MIHSELLSKYGYNDAVITLSVVRYHIMIHSELLSKYGYNDAVITLSVRLLDSYPNLATTMQYYIIFFIYVVRHRTPLTR